MDSNISTCFLYDFLLLLSCCHILSFPPSDVLLCLESCYRPGILPPGSRPLGSTSSSGMPPSRPFVWRPGSSSLWPVAPGLPSGCCLKALLTVMEAGAAVARLTSWSIRTTLPISRPRFTMVALWLPTIKTVDQYPRPQRSTLPHWQQTMDGTLLPLSGAAIRSGSMQMDLLHTRR